MKNSRKPSPHRLLWFMAAAACLSLPAMAQTAMPMHTPASAGQTPMQGAALAGDMKSSMMGGMQAMQGMASSGDVDKDFAMLMKLHHQQALVMAQMELGKGKSPEMKAMAQQIIAAQKKEIAQFDSWLAKNK